MEICDPGLTTLWFSLIIVRQEHKTFSDAADLLTVVFSVYCS